MMTAHLLLRLATPCLLLGLVACSDTNSSKPDLPRGDGMKADGMKADGMKADGPLADGNALHDQARQDNAAEGGAALTDSGESSARIELQVVGDATLTIKATSCSGPIGTWTGSMVMSAGGSGSGAFTLVMPATGTGTFTFAFPVAISGQTAQYTGTATAKLQSGTSQMALDALVKVITLGGTASANFSEVTPVIRGNNPACGGN